MKYQNKSYREQIIPLSLGIKYISLVEGYCQLSGIPFTVWIMVDENNPNKFPI